MRFLYLVFLLSGSVLLASPVSIPPQGNVFDQAGSLSDTKTQKNGFFKRIDNKRLLKFLKKNNARTNLPDAHMAGITGLSLGLVALACILLGAELFVFLGLIGFFFSIAALRKCMREKKHKKITMLLAISGLILNGLLVAGMIVAIIGAFMWNGF
ncbi:MAG: hypothetical protein IT262_20115 [Saprospiraceae bacterium]|nr:hypothetical protein [Saprospiraceae bacterium]